MGIPKNETMLLDNTCKQNTVKMAERPLSFKFSTFNSRESAARAGNDCRPPVSSQPVLVLNANYISRFLTYLTPPKT